MSRLQDRSTAVEHAMAEGLSPFTRNVTKSASHFVTTLAPRK
jgi:hypothetical protein